jgi:hypothetical protein
VTPPPPGPEQDAVVDTGEGRRIWVKVKDTDDLIEINLDKDRPESFTSVQARAEWEMASARKVPVPRQTGGYKEMSSILGDQ